MIISKGSGPNTEPGQPKRVAHFSQRPRSSSFQYKQRVQGSKDVFFGKNRFKAPQSNTNILASAPSTSVKTKCNSRFSSFNNKPGLSTSSTAKSSIQKYKGNPNHLTKRSEGLQEINTNQLAASRNHNKYSHGNNRRVGKSAEPLLDVNFDDTIYSFDVNTSGFLYKENSPGYSGLPSREDPLNQGFLQTRKSINAIIEPFEKKESPTKLEPTTNNQKVSVNPAESKRIDEDSNSKKALASDLTDNRQEDPVNTLADQIYLKRLEQKLEQIYTKSQVNSLILYFHFYLIANPIGISSEKLARRIQELFSQPI